MSVSPFDTNALNSLIQANASKRFDPSLYLDKMAVRLLSRQDADKDGDLDSSELPGLSEKAFKKLDTDGDGRIAKSEITAALQDQIDAIKGAFNSGGRWGVNRYLNSIKGTTSGELLQALAPRLHSRFGVRHDTSTSTQTQSDATQSTPGSSSLDLRA